MIDEDIAQEPIPPLRCAGVGLRGSGYPNAFNTLRRLRNAGIEIDDQVKWFPENTLLWKTSKGSLSSRVFFYSRLLLRNATEACRLCFTTAKDRRVTYVPYPSIFLLWWLSFAPSKWRPTLIIDAYISVWDATVRDRAILGEGGLSSRLLHAFEARAFRVADAILVDTVANKNWMIDSFNLAPSAIFPVPLAIDDSSLLKVPPRAPSNPLRVLYIGTFVPLHGIDVIMEAVRLAKDRINAQFHFIGDGQCASEMDLLLDECKGSVTRESGWLSHQQILERLNQYDICLGVFGGTGKASRVFPFKLYLALAAGKPVITQNEFSLPTPVTDGFSWAVTLEPKAIVDQLASVIVNPKSAIEAGRINRAFYHRELGEQALLSAWREVFLGFSEK